MIRSVKLERKDDWFNKKRFEAWNRIYKWEQQYQNQQLLIDFLVADAWIHTRSPGKRSVYMEYLRLPRQLDLFRNRPLIPIVEEILGVNPQEVERAN